MNGKKEELQRLIALHKARQEEARAAMEKVRDLLAKADVRRHREPQNQRKWNAVLDHLEISLDEARARIEASQQETLRLQEQLHDTQAMGKPDVEAVATTLATAGAAQTSTFEDTEKKLLAASFLDLGKFSLEQIALVQSHLLEQPEEKATETEQLLGRLELANQVRDEVSVASSDDAPEYQRRQLLLRAAIDKIQTNRIDTMTRQEIDLVISCHSLLSRRLRPTPKDERLVRILSAAIKVLQRKHAEFRKNSSA